MAERAGGSRMRFCALADSSPASFVGLSASHWFAQRPKPGCSWRLEESRPISRGRSLSKECEVRATNSGESQTAADAARIEVSLNWPWHAFFTDGRLFHSVVVEDVRGVVDLRPGGLPRRKAVPDLSEAEQRERAKRALQWLPEYFEMRRGQSGVCCPQPVILF